MQDIDLDVRYFIYQTFSDQAHPPTVGQIAGNFGLSNAEVQQSLDRLAEAHQIALMPGTHNIWMAHPFSGVKTDFTARVGHNEYWGN